MHEPNSGAVSPTQAFRSALYVARHDLYNSKNRQSKTLISGWYGLNASQKFSDTKSLHRYRSIRVVPAGDESYRNSVMRGKKDAL